MLERRSGVPDADEETVRIARRDFRRRRHAHHLQRWRTALIVLLTLATVAGGSWLVFFSPYVAVERVEISGNSSVAAGRVQRVARVPMGTPLARVDLDAIRARVESIAVVRRAEVSRAWPHGVHITVLERTAIAVIDRGEGLTGMDAHGVLFGSYGARPAELPLVRTEPDTRAEALVEAGRVIGALPAEIAAKVDVVEVGSVDQIRLILGNGRRVLWGSAEDSRQKAEVLAVLLRRGSQQIDVSVPGRPTTR